MVVGDDVDKQLEPYWELDLSPEEMAEDERAEFNAKFEAGDLEAEFEKWKKENEDSDFVRERNIKYDTGEEWVDDWYGYYLNKERTAYGYYHNPNAKWDWFSVGGRWDGFLINRAGERVDQARMKDIDWDAMRKDMDDKAKEAWEAYQNHDWEAEFEEHKVPKDKRDDYVKSSSWFNYNVQEGDTFEIYKAREFRLECFAFVKEQDWYERGEMGWFACVKDEKPLETWQDEFRSLVESVDPEELVSIVDCHI
jgi:hypothetical protein